MGDWRRMTVLEAQIEALLSRVDSLEDTLTQAVSGNIMHINDVQVQCLNLEARLQNSNLTQLRPELDMLTVRVDGLESIMKEAIRQAVADYFDQQTHVRSRKKLTD